MSQAKSYAKKCNNCNKTILMAQNVETGKWGAYEQEDGSFHKCGRTIGLDANISQQEQSKPSTTTTNNNFISERIDVIEAQFQRLDGKIDQLGKYIKIAFENLQRELQLLAEKYPELKELSELKTENAQLRQVIKEKGLNFEKASEIKIDPEKVEERITEYKEVEQTGNED